MTPSSIGERRGLIILLALILITSIVTAVISSVTPAAEQPLPADVTDSVTVTALPSADTVNPPDTMRPAGRKARKSSKHKSNPRKQKQPRYRSPLDEPV